MSAGALADSLPDKFGNALIDAWLATQGRLPENFSAVDRLCYIGTRGMGALEFAPVLGPKPRKSTKLEIDALVRLAGEVLIMTRRFDRLAGGEKLRMQSLGALAHFDLNQPATLERRRR